MCSDTCHHMEDAVNHKVIPSSVPGNARVYKDDCMFNFDTPDNNRKGLDVCLSCFQAFSRSDDVNYTGEHFGKTQHGFYLNIVKTLKPDAKKDKTHESEERQQKIAKLEIKETKESDVYDIINTVYCVECDANFDVGATPTSVQNIVGQILSANSTTREDDIKAWEQEIVPCEHSIDLQQHPYASSIDLSQCKQCDLHENLWICLHCGMLGCGRQQFGSTVPGNSHALSHYEVSGHPVAVKLGSLSANSENNCDVYCYQCNDEVRVPNVQEKLITFGIDIKSRVKTEKNLIELNLDQNLNWDFKLDGADGGKLQPVFGPGLTGFQNLGNSCYLNSVVQALFSLSNFDHFFQAKDFDDSVKDPALDLTSQLIKIHRGLNSGKYSKPNDNVLTSKGDQYQMGVKPSAFKTLIGEGHPEFKTQRQQDAFEFLLYLFDKLDNEYGFSLNSQLKFLMGNKVVCSSCHHGKLNYELVDNLALPVNEELKSVDEKTGEKSYKEISLIDCIRDYCASQSIEGFQCDHCQAKTVALQSSGFQTFPQYLVLNAKRIKLENWVPVKIDSPIILDEEIDLSTFNAPQFTESEVEEQVKDEEQDTGKDNQTTKFEANQEAMGTLLSMGFPEVRAVKGLFNTGNANAEDAMNWLFAHMDDADIDEPFDPNAATGGNSEEPSAELIDNLVAMGFNQQVSRKALILNHGDANAAVEWLFSNPDDDGVISDSATTNDKPVVNIQEEKTRLTQELLQQHGTIGKYKVKAVICHKGTSPHTGHYVAFIKKQVEGEDKWVLFNDEKVVACDETNLDDIKKTGYIYIFEKV